MNWGWSRWWNPDLALRCTRCGCALGPVTSPATTLEYACQACFDVLWAEGQQKQNDGPDPAQDHAR